MAFKKGQQITKVYHGTGGYEERAEGRVHHVSKGVAFLDDGQGGYETGITYDAQTGREKEMFFLGSAGIWSEIVAGADGESKAKEGR